MAENRVEALAEAWASMDRRLDMYLADEAGQLDELDGSYQGYNADASEMIRRLEERGYTVTRMPTPRDTTAAFLILLMVFAILLLIFRIL